MILHELAPRWEGVKPSLASDRRTDADDLNGAAISHATFAANPGEPVLCDLELVLVSEVVHGVMGIRASELPFSPGDRYWWRIVPLKARVFTATRVVQSIVEMLSVKGHCM